MRSKVKDFTCKLKLNKYILVITNDNNMVMTNTEALSECITLSLEKRAEANENTKLTWFMRVQILINDFSRCMNYVQYCLRSAGLFFISLFRLDFKNIFRFLFYITTKERPTLWGEVKAAAHRSQKLLPEYILPPTSWSVFFPSLLKIK